MIRCTECNGLGEVPDPPVNTAIRTHRGKLERGWRHTWLMGRLVRSEGSNASLAVALQCTPSAVQQFKVRHQEEIEDARARLAEQITGLWIADKLNRLAEMQTDVEDINTIIAEKLERAAPAPFDPLDPGNDGASTPSATDDLPLWLRTKLIILRNAAEELGQIPNKVTMQVGGSVITYKIDGVDMDRV